MVNALLALSLAFFAKPAFASVLTIQTLPSYVNTNSFKLSCTTDAATAQFSVSKHGGAFTNFGPLIDTTVNPCIVQVTSSEVNDQTDYVFSVNGGPTTSTNYDISGPSPVSGYYKEHVSDGFNKLHWTNPHDTDFSQVVIYRGDTPDFSADSSHEIGRVAGSPNSDMTYDDHYSPDGNKTHYYDIRAIDQAGNSSSLVGDGSTTTTTSTPTPAAGGGTVQVLPSEQGVGGSVLSKETSPSAEPTTEPLGTVQAKATSSGLSRNRIVGIGALAVLLGLLVYFFTRKRS